MIAGLICWSIRIRRRISEEVWALFDEACRRCHPRAVIIERDINLPAHQVTLAEVERARSVLVGHDYYRRPSVMSSA